MSYNGIGLQTARGSATNGFVQRNLSSLKPQKPHSQQSSYIRDIDRKPNKDLLEYERKRLVEVKCLELQDELEDKGLDEPIILDRVEALRKSLLQQDQPLPDGPLLPHQVHQIAEAKQRHNEKFQNAFGIDKDFQEGAAFDSVRLEKIKEDRLRKREERRLAYEERMKKQEEVKQDAEISRRKFSNDTSLNPPNSIDASTGDTKDVSSTRSESPASKRIRNHRRKSRRYSRSGSSSESGQISSDEGSLHRKKRGSRKRSSSTSSSSRSPRRRRNSSPSSSSSSD